MLKKIPVVSIEQEDYKKLLKIISYYSEKAIKKISIRETIINLIKEKELDKN